MTTMKEIQKLSDTDLEKLIEEKRAEVQKFRFGTGGRNVSAVRIAKTEIARAMTELTNRSKVANTAK